jgi:hypothetical protein
MRINRAILEMSRPRTEAGYRLVLSSPTCTMVWMPFPVSGLGIVVLRRDLRRRGMAALSLDKVSCASSLGSVDEHE